MSTYTFCGCYGCFDMTVSNDGRYPELCESCQEAGCENYVEGSNQQDCMREE